MANTFVFDDEEEPQPTMESPQEHPSDEIDEEDGGEEEGEGGNRNFLIAAIVLGVVILLTLICGAVFVFTVFIPRQNAMKAEQQLVALNASQTEAAMTETAVAQSFTATPTITETPTLEPTTTPVILFPTETQPVAAVDPATATVQALETRLAEVNLTATAQATLGTTTPLAGTGTPAPTALSQTGFADEVGLPGLFIVALILVAVILLARRLRQTPLAP